MISSPDVASLNSLIELPEMKEYVIGELVKAIEEGYKCKKSSIPLFHVYGTEFVLGLDKYQWETSLNKALKHYETKDDFQNCIKVRDLISKLAE